MKAVHLPDDDAFLRYIDVPGTDPPIIWLHGWQCSSTGELAQATQEEPLRGRRSLLVDFLGHGYSDVGLQNPRGMAAVAEAAAHAWSPEVDAIDRDPAMARGEMAG